MFWVYFFLMDLMELVVRNSENLSAKLQTVVFAHSGHSAVRVKGNRVVVFGGLYDKSFLHDLHVLDIGTVDYRRGFVFARNRILNMFFYLIRVFIA